MIWQRLCACERRSARILHTRQPRRKLLVTVPHLQLMANVPEEQLLRACRVPRRPDAEPARQNFT